MNTFRNLSIKNKLILIILGITVFSIIFSFTFIIINDIKIFKRDMVEDVTLYAIVIGDYSITDLAFKDKSSAEETLSMLKKIRNIDYACLYDAAGSIFAQYSKSGITFSPPPVQKEQTRFYDNYLNLYHSIEFQNDKYGTIYLRASTRFLIDKIRKYLLTMATLLLVLIGLSTFGAFKLQGYISRPILHLANVAKEISLEGNYSKRVRKTRDDETGVLYDGFNTMLEQIQNRELERDNAGNALRESEERFRRLAENAKDVIFRMSLPDGIYEYVSPASKDILGYSPEEFYANPKLIKKIITDESQAYFHEQWNNLINGKMPPYYEYGIVDKNSNVKWMHQRNVLILDKSGKPVAIEGIITDITNQKKVEEALREAHDKLESLVEKRTAQLSKSNLKLQEQILEREQAEAELRKHKDHLEEIVKDRTKDLQKSNEDLQKEIAEREVIQNELNKLRNLLSNIINSMPSILIGVDNAGKVTQWNKEAEKITGIQANTALGKTLGDVYPVLENEMEKVEEAIKRRKLQKDEKVPNHFDGETRFSDITVYPLTSNGVEGAVIRIDDVTSRVRMEEMMIQSEKMLSVGGLAAGMAHEINNPLAGILQSAQVILDRLSIKIKKNHEIAGEAGIPLEKITEYLKQRQISDFIQGIIESGKRASKIVENMLSFSRKSDSSKSLQSIKDILNSTIELASNDYDLKKTYDFRHIKIINEYSSDIPKIRCEKTKLQQVFLNLLKNAAQSMSGKKTEAPPKITLRAFVESGFLQIEVEDNGPGLDKKITKRIFEPFFTTKPVGVGTGLGLSVSYFIITENHNGKMSVESFPGQGTKFIIQLPLEKTRDE